ncbi:MAG TPA: DUF3857 domain-containing protein [candidate division Zixibacteria bacterium]
MCKLKALFCILMLMMVSTAYAELTQKEFGKVSQEELQMTSIQEDPDADAVILFDKGEYFFGHVYPVTLKRCIRIKVFTKHGKEFANITIPFFDGEKIREVEGYTYTKDGKKLILGQDQVFTKKQKYSNEVVFALPGVEEGCVFEYQYEKWSDYVWVLDPWFFQNELFTKLSQVSLELQEEWMYSYTFVNQRTANITPRVEDGYRLNKPVKSYIWSLENIPPIRREPYTVCRKDYLTAIHFERLYRKFPFSNFKDRIDTWEELGEDLDRWYDEYLEGKRNIKEKALDLTRDATSPYDKTIKIYNFVCRNVNWSGNRGGFDFGDKYLKSVLSHMLTRLEGTAIEKNLLLVYLLRAIGIEAHPVLISTRDNGKVNINAPGVFQLNHLIACVKIEGKDLFLDAVDWIHPFDILPPGDQATSGLLLDEKESRLIGIPSVKLDSKRHFKVKAQLREDAGITCSTTVSYQGYSNTATLKQIMEQGKTEFVKEEFLQNLPMASVDSIAYTSLDSIDQPLEINITLSSLPYAQVNGEILYVNPTIFTRLESNPFKNENRNYPVEFSYPFNEIEEVELVIPDGFEVKDLPVNVYREIPGTTFRKTFSLDANLIKCHRRFDIVQIAFPIEQYQSLRDFYQDIVSADNLQLVLTKKQN